MTATVRTTDSAAPEGSSVTVEDGGMLTAKGRAYKVLTIDGVPTPAPFWILGRDLALTA